MKKNKKTKTVYVVQVCDVIEKRSEHSFVCKRKAWDFYSKLKFALEIFEDDFNWVCEPKSLEVYDEGHK